MSLTAAIGSLFQKFVFGLIWKGRELSLIVEKLQCPPNQGDSPSPHVCAGCFWAWIQGTGAAVGECPCWHFWEPGWSCLQHLCSGTSHCLISILNAFILLPVKAGLCFKWNYTLECFLGQIPHHLWVFLYFHDIERDRYLHRAFLVWRATSCRQKQLETRPSHAPCNCLNQSVF